MSRDKIVLTRTTQFRQTIATPLLKEIDKRLPTKRSICKANERQNRKRCCQQERFTKLIKESVLPDTNDLATLAAV